MNKALSTALDILNKLVSREEVSQKNNRSLYNEYYLNTDVQELLENIAMKMGLYVYLGENSLFISAGLNNLIYGFKNEELRRAIPYVNKNEELYLCYFIIYNILSMLYKESTQYTLIDYLKPSQVYKRVDLSINAILEKETLDDATENEEYSLKVIAGIWNSLETSKKEDDDVFMTKAGKGTKMAYVMNVCRFMVSQDLLRENIEERNFSSTARLRVLIFNYFNNKDNKNRLMQILDDGGED